MGVKLRDNQSVRAPPWEDLNEVIKHFAVAVDHTFQSLRGSVYSYARFRMVVLLQTLEDQNDRNRIKHMPSG